MSVKTNTFVEAPEHAFPHGMPEDFRDSIYFNPTEIRPDRNPGVIMSWAQHFAQYFKKTWSAEYRGRSRRASAFEINLVWQGTSDSADTVGNMFSPNVLAEMRTQEAEICAEIKRYTGVGVASGDIKSITRYIYPDGFETLAPAPVEQSYMTAQLDYAASEGQARAAFPDSVGSTSLRLYGSNDMERTASAWRSQYLMTTLTIQQNPDDGGYPHGKHWIEFLEPYTLDKAKSQKFKRAEDGVKVAGKGGPLTQFIFVGDELSQTQLMSMLLGDTTKAVIALGSIFAYMLVHTGSFFLTLIGLFNILFAFPVGYWIYTALFGATSLPILTPVTLIVCIGIAVDDVFVFIDTFKQTDQEGGLSKRLAKTFSAAASATLFTTITSAAAFAANTVSDISALYNFGLFTALVILANYIILIILLPASLGFWWRYVAPWEAKVMIICIGCYVFKFPGNDAQVAPENDPDPDAPTAHAPKKNSTRARRPSNYIMSRIGADQKFDPLNIDAEPADDSASGAQPRDTMTRQEARDLETERLRSTLQVRRRSSQGNTMGSIVEGDTIGAQIAAAGAIHEEEEDGNLSDQPTFMGILLWKLGTFIVKYKYFVIAFYTILCIVLFSQAAKLQASQEGPQLFTPKTNLGRAAKLVDVFSDFSATAGSGVDIPPLSSVDESLADMLKNPSAQDAADMADMTCDFQFKPIVAPTATLTGVVSVPFLNCNAGTELVLNANATACSGKICTAEECCEITRSCKAYIATIDTELCSRASMQSTVSGEAEDITCMSPGGCEANDCCVPNRCDLYFENNPSKVASLCSGKTYTDSTSKASCANPATCTSNECCLDNPTCGASGFLLSSCNPNTHLKGGQNALQCAGKTCTAIDCCEANQQCQAYFDLTTNACQNVGKVEVVGTTTCTVDPCTTDECCKNQNCETAFGKDNSICPSTSHHLKANADTIFGTLSQLTKATCCDAHPFCPSSPSVCAAKKHLKPNPTGIQCTTATCTSVECCETNDVCSSVLHNSICTAVDKNYNVGATGSVCDTESCTDEDCCFGNCAEQSNNMCGSGANNPSKTAPLGGVTKCAADSCTTDECCAANPTCLGFANGNCASGTYLAADLGGLTCKGIACTSDDCCVDNPTCDSHTCVEAGTVNYGDDRTCSTSTCSAADCCKPLTCASINNLDEHCGASKNARAASTACPGFSCGNCPDTDNDNLNSCDDCCSEQARPRCKDWIEDNPTFCGSGKVGVDDSTRCDGQCTSADQPSCCIDVSYPTCDSIASTACSDNGFAARPNSDQITCSSDTCIVSDCCEPFKTCEDELVSTPSFCSIGQNLALDNLRTIDCTSGSCTTDKCCRSRTCADSGAPSCSAGTYMSTSNVCVSASSCTQSECCVASPSCASVGASVCTTTGKMLMRGDRSSTICAGETCIESDCCVDEPREVPLEIVYDCTGKSLEEINQAITVLKNQVAGDTGLSASDFTIELCNVEGRHRRAVAGNQGPAVRGRVWNFDGTRISRDTLSRSRRETTTMVIKLGSSLSASDVSSARDVLVNEEEFNPSPLDILNVDPVSGNITVTGNLNWTTTTTKVTSSTTSEPLPTEPIVLRPSKTRFAVGLAAPYVRKASNADEFLGGVLKLIPLTGQVQDERPIFDLNFNHVPGLGYVTLNDLAVTLSGNLNILDGTALVPYKSAQLQVGADGQSGPIFDLIAMCQRIANSTGLVNPGQLDTACALQNLEIAVRYKQPDCELLNAMQQQKVLDASNPSGWEVCSANPSVAYCGDFSIMVAMVAFTFESRFTSSDSNQIKVDNYEALEALMETLRLEYPAYDIRQANADYGTAVNELLSVSGAIWGIIVSLLLVFIAVVMFKANGWLTLIVFIMVIANLGSVVGLFHVLGWVLGGVEAVALSILVGTGVDYCIHMVEGFLETHPDHLEGKAKKKLEKQLEGLDAREQRDVCVVVALAHIGVPVLSAAITTGVCGLVLSFCELMMFKRFGEIILVNTLSSIILTLTFLPALLATIGPKSYHHTAKASVIGLLILCVVGGGIALVLFFVAKGGTCIVGPSGKYMFTSAKCSKQYI